MNRVQIIVGGVIALLVVLMLLVLVGIIPGLRPRPVPPYTLRVWGTDPAEQWEILAKSYSSEHPSATVTYLAKDPARYEEELLNALAAGQGPDLFMLRDSWIAKHSDKIRTLPRAASGLDARALKSMFADALVAAMTSPDGSLLGVPIAFDTLALLYNRDALNAATIAAPPATWNELVRDAAALTRLTEVGSIKRSGVALGTASNVDHAADILSLLIAQQGGAIVGPDGRPAIPSDAAGRALSFYTAFADPTGKAYAWNAFFDRSLAAFAAGDAAMAFAYSRDLAGVAAVNPQLNFDVAPVPQLDPDRPIGIGRFDLLSVSRTATHPNESWAFLQWLMRAPAVKPYLDALGLPPARRDLAAAPPPRDYLAPLYRQVLIARTVAIPADDSLGGILNAMIDGVASRKVSPAQALERAAAALGTVLAPPHE